MSLLKTAKPSARVGLGDLDAATAASLVTAAADLALVVDTDGMVCDLYVQDDDLQDDLGARSNWVGRSWLDLLNPASRPRGQSLLSEALAGRPGKWRHLNHAGVDGGDVPVLYAGVTLRRGERAVLFGRDLRPMSTLQQRLIDAQHSMERDHARLRDLERRYQLLLQAAGEPILVVNGATQRITEANPAIGALLDHPGEALLGQLALDLFAPRDRPALIAALATVRGGGNAAPVPATLDTTAVTLHLTLLREDTAAILIRALPAGPRATSIAAESRHEASTASLLRLVDQAPDGMLTVDAELTVRSANAAFSAMVGADPVGQNLHMWLRQPTFGAELLKNELTDHGAVRLLATTLTGGGGGTTAVVVSAVALAGEDGYGLVVRDVDRRRVDARPGRDLPRSVDQLTELIGRVALKDLVREATDMIERLCIEAALQMTNDNRASAAELLGLSRQSLYVKLHRYGLGDLLDAQG